MKVEVITLGCKVNQYESQAMLGRLEEEADAHIDRCGVSYFPISMEAHMELLKRVGFRSVYVFWKSGMQMGIMGVK